MNKGGSAECYTKAERGKMSYVNNKNTLKTIS